MFKSLTTRLTLVLILLFLLISVLFIVLNIYTSQQYHLGLVQRANLSLAPSLVSNQQMKIEDALSADMIGDLASDIAITQPGIELYVLDLEGRVVGSSIDSSKVVREFVDMTAIDAYFTGHAGNYPIRGTDPKDLNKKNVFSISPIPAKGQHEGYLYILLSDENQDIFSNVAQNNTVRNLSIISALVLLCLLLGLGFLLFNVLTKRISKLNSAMLQFEDNDFQTDAVPLLLETSNQTSAEIQRAEAKADELQQLNFAFGRMAGKIEDQITELKSVDELRRELISNVSHDLRTPLAALQGYLETMHIKWKDLSEEDAQNYLGIAQKHTQRLSSMIEDLFELSRLDAGQVTVRLEPFAIQELSHDIVQGYQIIAQKKGVELKLQCPDNMLFVNADIALIERVLSNLLDNAIRHTPEGGKVTLINQAKPTGVYIAVQDTGVGISKEDQERIFERFYRADQRKGDQHKGAGLGLAISQRIIELHNSLLQVDSNSYGSNFFFELDKT